MAGKRGGGRIQILLVLLVILGGVGGFNYYRNWQTEAQEQGPRPFEGYSDQDLTSLAEAYRSEIAQLEKRDTSARSLRSSAMDSTFLGARVKEFERVQRSSDKLRGLATEIGEREARVREIDAEIAYRERTRGVDVHIQRLTGGV